MSGHNTHRIKKWCAHYFTRKFPNQARFHPWNFREESPLNFLRRIIRHNPFIFRRCRDILVVYTGNGERHNTRLQNDVIGHIQYSILRHSCYIMYAKKLCARFVRKFPNRSFIHEWTPSLTEYVFLSEAWASDLTSRMNTLAHETRGGTVVVWIHTKLFNLCFWQWDPSLLPF